MSFRPWLTEGQTACAATAFDLLMIRGVVKGMRDARPAHAGCMAGVLRSPRAGGGSSERPATHALLGREVVRKGIIRRAPLGIAASV